MRKASFWAVLFGAAVLAAIAAEGKIDPQVREKMDSEGKADVLIFRTQRDSAFEPQKIKQAYRARLDHISGEMRAIRKRANSLARKGGTGLSPAEADELADLRAGLEFERESMRRAVGRAAEESSREGLELLANRLHLLGAEVRQPIFSVNALGATVPVSTLEEIAAMPEVAAIRPEPILKPELDVSVETCGFHTWWNESHLGAGTDLGIVDLGVFENHPSFVHVPDFHGRPGDNYSGFHGTAVAGVVIMDNSIHFGAAYGLDSVVWARGDGPVSIGLAALEWVASQGPEIPEVINFSLGSDPVSADHTNFEIAIDALLDDQGILLSKSAGNEGWDNSASTLTPPGRAYNPITVAAMNDKGTLSRSDDWRYVLSSTGPTPWGRRKPDITAPGDNITTSTTGSPAYGVYSGTSLAAPHVSAAVMLLAEEGNVDPLAQKAVLINTAQPWYSEDTATGTDDYSSPVSNWDKSYGWGYLDVDRAYEERDKYVTGDIWPKGGSTGPKALYYTHNMELYDKVTLVWNRHTENSFFGLVYRDLADLSLELYNYADDFLIDSDDTPLDNVHQVQMPWNGPTTVVVKVSNSNAAFDGYATERFALAGIGESPYLLPPEIWFNIVDGPVWVHPLDPVITKFSIKNTGQLPVHNNQMIVDYGRTGITPADGNTGPRDLPSLQPGESITYELELMADVPEGSYELPVSLSIRGYGEQFDPDPLTIVVEVPRH